jgi:hypothetical protein
VVTQVTAALAVVCALTVAGCSSPTLEQVPNPPFRVSASPVPDRSLPPAADHWASPDRLAKLRQSASEIVNDMLDDLVPA